MKNASALLLCILVFAAVFSSFSPSQPKGYQQYICGETWKSTLNACASRDVTMITCRQIAEVAHDSCVAATPEKNATPG